MNRIALLLITSLLAPAVAQAAPKADQYYAKTFNDCISAAVATMQMRDCLNEEYTAWDKSLNQVYQTLMAARGAPEQTRLRDDERAWLKRTKAKCDHAGNGEQGGSLQPVEIDQCNLDETVLRTVYLRGLR